MGNSLEDYRAAIGLFNTKKTEKVSVWTGRFSGRIISTNYVN